jgi:hypothetical protein
MKCAWSPTPRVMPPIDRTIAVLALAASADPQALPARRGRADWRRICLVAIASEPPVAARRSQDRARHGRRTTSTPPI